MAVVWYLILGRGRFCVSLDINCSKNIQSTYLILLYSIDNFVFRKQKPRAKIVLRAKVFQMREWLSHNVWNQCLFILNNSHSNIKHLLNTREFLLTISEDTVNVKAICLSYRITKYSKHMLAVFLVYHKSRRTWNNKQQHD